MKKMMIALLVVLSIFMVVSCSSEVIVTETKTVSLTVDKAAASTSVTYKSSAKLYKALETGYVEVVSGDSIAVGAVGTVKVTYSVANSKLDLGFNYTAAKAANKTESVKLYYGVVESGLLSKDYAEITVSCTDKKDEPVPPVDPSIKVSLAAETQSDKGDKVDFDLTTTEETLKVYQVTTSGNHYVGDISTDDSLQDVESFAVENDLSLKGWTVGKVKIEAIGRSNVTGVQFVLDTMYDAGNKNGALGAGEANYTFIIKDSEGTELNTYKVSAVVSNANVNVNNIVGSIAAPYAVPSIPNTDVYCYNDETGKWVDVTYGMAYVPVYNYAGEYIGKVTSNNGMMVFSTADYTTESGKELKAIFGSGKVTVGLNKDLDKNLFAGTFVLACDNIEVSAETSTVVSVTDSKSDRGYFEILAEKGTSMYCRELFDGYASKTESWDEWKKYDDSSVAVRTSAKASDEVGKFDVTRVFTAGGFKCLFDASDNANYGKTGYLQLAVVNDDTGAVLETIWFEGTNGWSKSEE